MGYVYDSVIATLGGKSLVNSTKDGSLVSGWSPNMYRRVAILTDGVVVELHDINHSIRTFSFDLQKVAEDMSQGARYKSPLRPLFEYKVLSCLEEVIISNSLVTDQMIKTYLATLVNTHRLRNITVVDGNVKVTDIKSLLEQLNEKKDFYNYTVDKFVQGSKTYSTKVEDFHKRYYLRPALYKMDSTEGTLRRYFDKIKYLVEEENNAKRSKDITSAFIEYDRSNLDSWSTIVKFLTGVGKTESEYSGLSAELKKYVLAGTTTFTHGLKGYYSDASKQSDPLRLIYGSLGYFRSDTVSQPKQDAKGYLKDLELVGKNVQSQIAKLLKSSSNESLKSLRISRNANAGDVLIQVLKVLNSEVNGTEDEDYKTDFRSGSGVSNANEEELKGIILQALPEELMVGLLDVVEACSSSLGETIGLYLGNKDSSFKFSERKLVDLGLSRHAEALSLFGYCGGDADLISLSNLSFTKGLNGICKHVTKSLSEMLSARWESLSDVEKCSYIISKVRGV